MRKIIIIAALILLGASLASCDMIKKIFPDDIKVGDKSETYKS